MISMKGFRCRAARRAWQVDDMRPALGAYNFSLAHTPNLDKLAAEGLTFARHYVQCGLFIVSKLVSAPPTCSRSPLRLI
jgi:hypothetical protein